MNNDNLYHHGIKGQKWGVRRFQNKDGSLTAKGKKRYNDDEYDEEREALEKENARRAGVKYVRKTKKEREAEDAENERKFNARLEKDTAAQKRTEDRMKEIDKKLQAKYDLSSMDDLDKYYKEYDEAWFEILAEERKKGGLSHLDMSKDELYHYGIKGQKWGVRRFQNKDGTLTPAGEKRYNSEKTEAEREAEKKLDEAMRTMQKAMFKRSVASADAMVKKASESYGKMSKAKEEAAKKEAVKKIKDDASKMSDKELQAIVNRLNMEERYTQIMSSRVETGRDRVGELLETVGKIVATGVTVMTLMDKMEKLKIK